MRRGQKPDRSIRFHWIGNMRWGYMTGIATDHPSGTPRIILGVVPRAKVHGEERPQIHKLRHAELDHDAALKLRNHLDELIDQLQRNWSPTK